MIYTSITGERDKMRDDIKVFSYDAFKSDRMNAKIAKILPHYFIDEEYSVWVDGNVFPLKTEEEYIKLLDDKDIAVFRHPERKCIYDEAMFCRLKGKDGAQIIEDHIKRYNLTNQSGLYACGFIIRRHTERMKQLCEKWWAEICTGSSRDQISFPYVFPKDEIKVLEGNIWANDLVEFRSHLK